MLNQIILIENLKILFKKQENKREKIIHEKKIL